MRQDTVVISQKTAIHINTGCIFFLYKICSFNSMNIKTTSLPDLQLSQCLSSQSHVTTDDQSVSMSWCQVHSGTRDQILYSVWTLLCCLCWGALSDERSGLSSVSHFQQCLVHCQALVMMSSVFLYIMLCSPMKVNWCFGGTFRPYLQGPGIRQAREQ
jgi:hypothetical protein